MFANVGFCNLNDMRQYDIRRGGYVNATLAKDGVEFTVPVHSSQAPVTEMLLDKGHFYRVYNRDTGVLTDVAGVDELCKIEDGESNHVAIVYLVDEGTLTVLFFY